MGIPLDLEDFRKIEKKWQKKWLEARIFEPKILENKEKFFLTVPYPYTNGPLHIGHGRTYTLGDIIARYKRLAGYNVLFPMAFHITGTPIAAISDRIKRGEQAEISKYRHYLSLYEKDPEKIEHILKSFEDPINVAVYFAERIHVDFTALGYSIDWRRKFHTGEGIYNKFIEWQYMKLKEKNLLKRGTHYVTYCLLHKQPEGEDDIKDADIEPVEILEFVAIKFQFEDGYILASTLRPETIFGATNLWANPNVKYLKIRWNNEILYISKDALVKFQHQYDNVEVIEELDGTYFVGKFTKTPLDAEIIILPADFVDPDNATGFVYSEPSDAPYDFAALEDVKKHPEELQKYGIDPEFVRKIEPIKIIDMPNVKGHHAEKVIREMGIVSQTDVKLEEATKKVYKEQYYDGVMNEKAGQFAGVPVKEAKEKVKEWLLKNNKAIIFYETSRKAICRAGGKIIVAKIKDQWFIDYSPDWWKDETRKWLDQMLIYPSKYKKLFYDTVDWLHERPCARRRGLGTRLPFDKTWIIESLSDSTIYMAFYTIAHILRKYKIKPEQLKPSIFDYIFLNKGNLDSLSLDTGIPKEAITEMKREFEYWYPVDQRHTGIPHISNHLTFFIMHHIAIFDKKDWPKMITLNDMVIAEGAKMSKSKGNVILLRDIAEKYSADLFRLFVCSAADLDGILDWREKEVANVKSRLIRFATLALKAANAEIPADFGEHIIDRWLLSRFNKRLKMAKEQMEKMAFRDFTINMFFEFLKEIAYYERRTSTERMLGAIRRILEPWIITLSPVIPHITEEIWEKLGNTGFVSLAKWPEYNENLIDERSEILEDAIRNSLKDVNEILKAMRKTQAKIVTIVIADNWKRSLLEKVKDISKRESLKMNIIMKEVMKDPDFRKLGKTVSNIINKIMRDPSLLPKIHVTLEKEMNLFINAKEFLERELSCEVRIVKESDVRDNPKAKAALPLKPGIIIEF